MVLSGTVEAPLIDEALLLGAWFLFHGDEDLSWKLAEDSGRLWPCLAGEAGFGLCRGEYSKGKVLRGELWGELSLAWLAL